MAVRRAMILAPNRARLISVVLIVNSVLLQYCILLVVRLHFVS